MPKDRIRFTLNGTSYELSRAVVEFRLADVQPEALRKHAVRIDDILYPVMQAFEAAIGVSRRQFISHTARRHLAALDFEVSGEVDSRTAQLSARPLRLVPVADPSVGVSDVSDESWHTEANVQAAAVSALAADGWRIHSVANTATKEHGIDIIASRDGMTVDIEVKGFRSKKYADPARAQQ